jgi:hypothetical protein
MAHLLLTWIILLMVLLVINHRFHTRFTNEEDKP